MKKAYTLIELTIYITLFILISSFSVNSYTRKIKNIKEKETVERIYKISKIELINNKKFTFLLENSILYIADKKISLKGLDYYPKYKKIDVTDSKFHSNFTLKIGRYKIIYNNSMSLDYTRIRVEYEK